MKHGRDLPFLLPLALGDLSRRLALNAVQHEALERELAAAVDPSLSKLQ